MDHLPDCIQTAANLCAIYSQKHAMQGLFESEYVVYTIMLKTIEFYYRQLNDNLEKNFFENKTPEEDSDEDPVVRT